MIDNRSVVEDFLTGLQEGVPGVKNLMSADAQWEFTGNSPLAGKYVGRKNIFTGLLRGIADQFEPGSLHIELKNSVAEGDFVVVESSSQGTTTTGVQYQNDYCFVFRVTGGQIQHVREYTDTGHLERTLFPGHRGHQGQL
jgi:ketosteroid isomerase-like protein